MLRSRGSCIVYPMPPSLRSSSFIFISLSLAALGACAPDAPRPPADGGGRDGSSGPGVCTDGVQNGGETDVDCGGTCDPCAGGQGCAVDADCAAGVCGVRLRCLDASCNDHTRNGTETDEDCGGDTCPGCRDGRSCISNADCMSMRCESGVCFSPQCEDGVRSGDESDVDCGGTMCAPCEAGHPCNTGADCTSTVCDAGTCTVPRCDDTLLNGLESDVDCGGSACPGCAAGQMCGDVADCESGVCTSGACVAPACDDGVLNGDEVGVDCAGSCPSLCAAGVACTNADQCDSRVCDAGVCTAAACDDAIRNGGETDVDCGGATTCPRCADYKNCTDPTDCTTAACTMGRCGSTGCMPFPGTSTDAFGYFGCTIPLTPTTLPCPDISTTGTSTGLSDDSNINVPIGFTFDYYGTPRTTVDIQSNGGVTFDPGYLTLANACFPRTATPRDLVAVFWDDLYPPGSGGTVRYQTLGTAPNRQFVVRWNTVLCCSGTDLADMTMVLHETSNDIDVCYKDVVFSNTSRDYGLNATVGINGPTSSLEFSCNTASLTDGLLIQYIHP